MYTVYILKSISAEKFYTGQTDNLTRRIKEHNSGKNYYTNRYKPWEVIYTEEFEDIRLAVKRERYLKSHAGRR